MVLRSSHYLCLEQKYKNIVFNLNFFLFFFFFFFFFFVKLSVYLNETPSQAKNKKQKKKNVFPIAIVNTVGYIRYTDCGEPVVHLQVIHERE